MDDINDILDVIDLYIDDYPVWNGAKVKEIFYHIYPSLALGQCKVHRDEDGVYGYRNWAFLNEETEKNFLETREIGYNDWNSGDRLWVIDSIFKRKHNEAMLYYRTFFTHLIGIGKPVQWLRLAANGLIRSHIKLTTREYHL
jgi:hemolysin-activating ACP:hemolysin acyltransferase